jgi:hypothetical protein
MSISTSDSGSMPRSRAGERNLRHAVPAACRRDLLRALPGGDAQAYRLWQNRARLDNSGSHISGKVHWPKGIEKIPLPPYSPELNPVERWFEALRRVFANAIFDTLDDLKAALTEVLRPYCQIPAKLQRLVGFPWWCCAITGLSNTAPPA